MTEVVVTSEPDIASTRPSPMTVAVGYQREYAMSGPSVHCLVIGSKMLVRGRPVFTPLQSCPPTTSRRPSARNAVALQKMSLLSSGSGLGTGVKVLVAGSQMVAELDPMQSGPPSHIRIWPVRISDMLIATNGQSMTEDHCPPIAGSGTVLNVQVLLAAIRLPLRSRTTVPVAPPRTVAV
jgi:hypothetical protein